MPEPISIKTSLIIGASSKIALSIIETLITDSEQHIIAITRKHCPKLDVFGSRVRTYFCDYSEKAVKESVSKISALHFSIDKVFICNGALHGDFGMPEKQLGELNLEATRQLFEINTFIPLLWLSNLGHLVKSKKAYIVFLSARVGSISDNRLGGWYSYRASKAALNMLCKSAAIELKRRHKQWRFLLYHPGTVDTPLSKPFQANVPDEKLFSADFSASQLLKILPTLSAVNPIHYLDWQGKSIEW